MTSDSMTSEPSTISAATIGNAADDGSAGTTTSAPCSSGSPVSAILRPCAPSLVRDDVRAKVLQHQLGVVAARFLLDHGGDARRGKAREQHRRLDLGGGHRGPVGDRHGISGRRCSVSGSRPPSLHSPALAPISSSGSRIRRIGRLRSEASPSNTAVIGQPATAPITSRQPVPELPKSSGFCRLGKAADAHAIDLPREIPGPLDPGAQRPHGFGGVEDVFALQKAGNPAFADRKRAQDQGPVRDRLVAGNADFAAQGAAGTGFQRRRVVGMGQDWCPLWPGR